ncbi:hypothetical protein [Hymenobacter sp. GOD-10R]|uniref:hypothetical protein n=1 Tax=Hymenobacter sp. GOD-10R TaxID=3093922 RepID=UPI002D79B006|nr:hypothetical protein [Hymenobacter sp. GOD-10R]WRQ28300.1 hypothetical protein SD425_24845 [Hymenobacter sp. GOD-10R]
MYLPSAFINHDLGDGSYVTNVRYSYHKDEGPVYGLVELDNGRKVFKYPIGMALFYAPYFTAAHAYALATGESADGFSVSYQQFVALGCLAYVLIGLWILGLELRQYFSDSTAALAMLVVGLGTNLLYYATFETAMAHGTLFMLNALLLRLTRQWYQSGRWKYILGLGLTLGLIGLVRPSELLMAGVPVLWGISGWKSVPQRFLYWQKHLGQVVVAVLLFGAVSSIQLLFWKTVGDKWVINFYPGEHFDFLHPHLVEGLFSFKKGWLIYSPLMAFALLGLFFLRRDAPDVWLPALILIPLGVYIIFSWEQWWYGGGFGARPVIGLYPLLSLGLASFWQRIIRVKAAALVLVSCLVLLNLVQIRQYSLGILDCCDMTREKYKQHFFEFR